MRNIVMGVAAIALAASGAYAQPGNGNGGGNGNGKGGGNAAAAGHKGGGNGHGNAKADRGNGNQGGGKAQASANRGNGNGNGNAPNMAARGNGNANAKADNGNRGNGNERMTGNGNGNGNANRNAVVRGNGNGNNGNVRIANRGNGNGNDGYEVIRYSYRDSLARDYGLIDGCPPGLAKKNNGCNPPGLVKRDHYDYDRANWWGLPGLGDGRYRYYDNNLVRLSDAGAILGYYPLLGGALSSGNVWPSWFDYQPVPSYYESYYGLGQRDSYRYADNALYRVDPETMAITSVAALLTGDTFTVGQPMPSGYGVYNVPYGYRDRYVDGPNSMYRYSDGYVYEIDPTTRLVSAAIELLI
ncbi:hypothetical protein [Croceicoccus sediminis]|uniref:hypothetical protein n=1 Tax=Croceicoccus sediminis TaxID=2571150 RepID=UPI0011828E2A|nr:hypothetical protein [Croceicoccus sediminis]